ncbi:MAG: hypothetical protein KDK05_29640, partial [Candidatus Competibacteraceae bacterium]|nr:hypothetical protein [Candidatus Competibacteraceae bacterium]
VNLKNSIIAGNSVGTSGTGPDCDGTLTPTTPGYNFIGDNSGCTGFPAGNPNANSDYVNAGGLLLGGLTGDPAYHPHQPGSTALDKVPVANCTFISSGKNPLFSNGAAVTADQRGVVRPQGTHCDIGAYESAGFGSLTIVKTVVNDNGGTLSSSDFTINVSGNNPSQTSFAGSESGVVVTVEAGAYSVTEDPVAGYSGSFSADCSGDIAAGENKTCTVTNDDIAPTITVTKVVIPASDTGVFSLTIDEVSHAEGGNGTSTGAIAVSVGTRSIGETGASGTDLADYDRVIGGDCAADGTITVALADNASCTLT